MTSICIRPNTSSPHSLCVLFWFYMHYIFVVVVFDCGHSNSCEVVHNTQTHTTTSPNNYMHFDVFISHFPAATDKVERLPTMTVGRWNIAAKTYIYISYMLSLSLSLSPFDENRKIEEWKKAHTNTSIALLNIHDHKKIIKMYAYLWRIKSDQTNQRMEQKNILICSMHRVWVSAQSEVCDTLNCVSTVIPYVPVCGACVFMCNSHWRKANLTHHWVLAAAHCRTVYTFSPRIAHDVDRFYAARGVAVRFRIASISNAQWPH